MQDSDSLLPLVIGVTGHRNPAAETVATLEREFEERLRRLDALAPNTPFILLTPLALGCDRMAARVALRFKRSRADRRIEVIGVLPLAVDDYRQDFAGDTNDAAEFEELLCQVDYWFELPRWDGSEVDGRGFVSRPEHRDIHYRRLGLFVALQSQVMIAMWDGVRANKVGGTAEVVDFCLGKRTVGDDCGIPFRKTPWLLVAPDRTPVLCIPTRREGRQPPSADADQLSESGFDAHDAGLLRELDFLNVRLASGPALDRPESGSMFDLTARPEVSDRWRRLVERCRRLDALAGASKRRFMRNAWLIPLVAMLGVSGFQWYSSFAGDFPAWAWVPLLGYLLLLAAAFCIWWSSRHWSRTEQVFVHARALAEALRIQLAWTGSGLDDVATDRYFARRSKGVRFLRAHLRAAVLDSMIVNARGGFSDPSSIDVGRRWVHEQRNYFAPQSKRMLPRVARVQRFGWLARTLNAVALCLSICLFVAACADAVGEAGWVQTTADWGCFMVGVALAAAVAFDYWRDTMLDEEDLREAERMHGVYAIAEDRLADPQGDPRETIRAMGIEALDEHADWFGRHQDRLGRPSAG